MRNGYKVYDADTHIQPSADTLEEYLSARVRELVPDLECRKVPPRPPPEEADGPVPKIFRLRSGAGGWGADAPRRLGEAEPRDHVSGVSGHFMGSMRPRAHTDDWDVEGRIADMDEEGVDVQLLVNPGGPSVGENRAVDVEFMHRTQSWLSRTDDMLTIVVRPRPSFIWVDLSASGSRDDRSPPPDARSTVMLAQMHHYTLVRPPEWIGC